MTPETWTFIGFGIVLAGLIISGQRGLKSDTDYLVKPTQAIKEGQAGLRERLAH